MTDVRTPEWRSVVEAQIEAGKRICARRGSWPTQIHYHWLVQALDALDAAQARIAELEDDVERRRVEVEKRNADKDRLKARIAELERELAGARAGGAMADQFDRLMRGAAVGAGDVLPATVHFSDGSDWHAF